MLYREAQDESRSGKTAYRDGIENWIVAREALLSQERMVRCADIFANADVHRAQFCAMLGYPLTEKRVGTPNIVTDTLLGIEGDYAIHRMQFEVLPSVCLSGLFFRYMPTDDCPFVIAQHGGLGTPELIAGFYDGQTANYNDMVERLLPYRVHVFAPQLLLWNKETYGETYDRQSIDARLKRVGSSITAIELYGLMRLLDWAETISSRFGMIGLSYGGFYTLFLAAVDTRIRSAVSSSFFCERSAYPWIDWTWWNAATLYDDAEIACLAYPRRLCVQMGTKDELFSAERTAKEAERVRAYCTNAGVSTDWFDCTLFDGTHELYRGNEAIARMMDDLLVE